MLKPKKNLFEDVTEQPREHYTFRFDPQKAILIQKTQLRSFHKGMIVCIAFLAVIATVCALFRSQITGFILGGLFSLLVLYIKSASLQRKAWTTAMQRLADTVYDYSLYANELIVWTSSDRSVEQRKYQLCDIKKPRIVGDFVVLEMDNKLYILNKDELLPNSYFLSRCYQG